MNTMKFIQTLTTTTTLALLALSSPSSVAADTQIAGQFKVSYSKQEAIPVPDVEGQVLLLAQAEGSNVTNAGDYMGGAQVTNREILDLRNGNGRHSGYVTFTKDGSTVVDKWSGNVTTTLNPDGSPNITFEGSFEKISGTGKYQGIQGSGTYKGYFTSEKEYVVDWTGYYSLK